ncbi:hypothetical protein V8C34DRAFT_279645 [Trichoderma compactum]
MSGTTDKRLRLAIPYVTLPCLVAAEHDHGASNRFVMANRCNYSLSSCGGAYLTTAGSGRMTAVFAYLIKTLGPYVQSALACESPMTVPTCSLMR